MEIKFDKEMLKSVGEKGWRLTKAIAVEGSKALLLKTAAKAINASYEEGFDGVKKIGFDDIVGPKPEDKPRKKWFSRNKEDKVEELIEEVVEVEIEEPEVFKQFSEEELAEPKVKKSKKNN